MLYGKQDIFTNNLDGQRTSLFSIAVNGVNVANARGLTITACDGVSCVEESVRALVDDGAWHHISVVRIAQDALVVYVDCTQLLHSSAFGGLGNHWGTDNDPISLGTPASSSSGSASGFHPVSLAGIKFYSHAMSAHILRDNPSVCDVAVPCYPLLDDTWLPAGSVTDASGLGYYGVISGSGFVVGQSPPWNTSSTCSGMGILVYGYIR